MLTATGSYLVSGPPNMGISDISFKLRYITRACQSFSRIYDRFGHTEVEQSLCLWEASHMIVCTLSEWVSGVKSLMQHNNAVVALKVVKALKKLLFIIAFPCNITIKRMYYNRFGLSE